MGCRSGITLTVELAPSAHSDKVIVQQDWAHCRANRQGMLITGDRNAQHRWW